MSLSFKEYKKKNPRDIPIDFTEDDYERMLEHNPYKPSTWFFPTPHEAINSRYILGWIEGRYNGFSAIMDWIKRNKTPGWTINKEDLRELFAEITQEPDFGLKKENK